MMLINNLFSPTKNGIANNTGDIKIPASGIVFLTAKINNFILSSDPNLKINLKLKDPDFFSAITQFDIHSNENQFVNLIDMMPRTQSTNMASSFNQTSINLTDNIVNQTVSLNTPVLANTSLASQIMDNASVSVSIPANTAFYDENGNPFIADGDVTIAIKFISADPNAIAPFQSNPLFNFPGGLDIDSLEGDGPSELNGDQNISFISAGFVAIEIFDESNNQVSQFGGDGLTLNFNVPKSTINPNTKLPFTLADQYIPLWSYNQNTGKWRYEGRANVLSENEKNFTLQAQVTHLSYYNLDWYGSDRCNLDIKVVDLDGVANNQSLQVSFTRKSGGWARKSSGWGEPLDNLNIKRVPAFEGYFNLFDSSGNQLLASIEVNNQKIDITDTDKGILLDDFCFGETSDNDYSFTAKLNISNPPRIDISPSITLACPTDNTQTANATDGWYSIYENYSYKGSGQLSGDTLSLNNLTEGANYLFYYSGANDWGRTEFTASSGLLDIQVDALSLCPTIEQPLNVQFICVDDDQNELKSKPAADASYWVYNSDYWQYMWGNMDADGYGDLEQTIDGFEYFAYAYAKSGADLYWRWGTDSFTVGVDTDPEIDIILPSTDTFCTTDLSIDYSQSTFTASSSSTGAGDDSKITLSIQAKDEFANNITPSPDELSFLMDPTSAMTIDNIQNLGNGAYTADAYSDTIGSVTVTALIGGEALTNNLTLTFTNAVSFTNDVYTSDINTVIANNTDVVTLNLQLFNFAGTAYGKSAGDLSFTLPNGYTLVSNIDNNDGTYTSTICGTQAGTLTLTPMIDGQLLSTSLEIEFTSALDISKSSFSLNNNTVDADGSSTTTATVMLRNFNNDPYILTNDTLTYSIDGVATQVSSTDNGEGNYTATFSSTTAGDNVISAHVDNNKVGEGTVTFTATGHSQSQSNLTVSTNGVSTGNTITATVNLKNADGSDYGQSGGALLVTTDSNVTVSNNNDNANGIYTFDLTSSVTGTYTVSVSVGGILIDQSVSVSFTTVDTSKTVITPDPLVIDFTGSSPTGSVTVSLLQADNSSVGHGNHTIAVSSTYIDFNFITHDTTTDNGDGTYILSFTCLGSYPSDATVTILVDTVASNSFQLDCD